MLKRMFKCKTINRVTLMVLLVFSLTVVLTGCGSKTASSSKEIKIGLVGDMSGGGAVFGQQMKKGAELAVEEINKAGGINGMTVKLLVEDDKGSPQEAVKATEKLVTQDKIDAWMGTLNSSGTLAALEVTNKADVLSMVPIAVAENITQMGYKNVFRNCITNPMQCKALSSYILNQRPERKFAILAENTDYGQSLVKNFTPEINNGGGTILATEYYKPGDKDFYNQLTKIKSLNPDGLVIAGLIAEGSQIVNQAKELGIKAQLYSFGGFIGKDPVRLAGEAGEGLIHTELFIPVPGDPVSDQFVSGYKAKYGEEPEGYYPASIYDAVLLIKTAMEKAGETRGEKVYQAMSQTKDFPALLGKINFDDKGQATLKVWIAQITGGKQVVIYKPQ